MIRIVPGGGLVVSATVAAFLLATWLAAEETGTPSGSRSNPVTRREVWQAVVDELHARDVPELRWPRIDELDLPAGLPAISGRTLRVTAACWDEGPQRTQFRLECGEPGQCLPFLVFVHVHGHSRVQSENEGKAYAGACGSAPEAHSAREASPKILSAPTMHPGDRATAVFVSERLRIAATVTCLERGREGEVIRVRNQDGEIFRARISGPALLEALPR